MKFTAQTALKTSEYNEQGIAIFQLTILYGDYDWDYDVKIKNTNNLKFITIKSHHFSKKDIMKQLLLTLFTLFLVTSTGVNAAETATPPTEQLASKTGAITEGTLQDTQRGCACRYTVKNLRNSPLTRFEAYISVKNEQGKFRCDAVLFSFNKPIQPNESQTLSNEAYGKSCGTNPSVSLLMVNTCNYADGLECDTENIETTDSGLTWVE